jgi:cysteinyl-tRNA synthetase
VALEPLTVAEEPVAPPVSSGPGVAELQLVAAIEAVRAAARADGRFDLADQLRDALGAYGVSSADGALKR